jgi:hypothetical protein
MRASVVHTALLCVVVGNAMAADTGIPPQVQSSPDMSIQRLERLRQPSAHSPEAVTQAILIQAEVIRLAKTAAKQAIGKQFDDYELTSVIFETTTRKWTVTFDPKPPRRTSEECLLVIVNDDTKETKALRC